MSVSRRGLGWLLVVYGAMGLALVTGGAFIGLDLAGRVERVAAEADTTLMAAARATEATADAFENVDGSLAEARASSDAAAALAREAAGTLASLAVAMELSVFGAQPLQPLAGEFAASADQASALADTLDDVGSSLGDTRTDAARIGPELTTLSEQLSALGADPERPRGTVGSPPLRAFVVLLLAWVGMQAFVSLVAGITLVRSRTTAL